MPVGDIPIIMPLGGDRSPQIIGGPRIPQSRGLLKPTKTDTMQTTDTHVRPPDRGLQVSISRHARKRAHERAGLNRSAISRTATRAARFGTLLAGAWTDRESPMPVGCLEHPNIVRHNQFLYFFSVPQGGMTTLITLYRDPFV